MNKIFTASLVVVAALMLPIAGHTADADRSSATTYAKDSVITTKIKTLLAEEKLSNSAPTIFALRRSDCRGEWRQG